MSTSVCKGVLHVEVRIRPTSFVRADAIRDEVSRWLLRNFKYLSVGDHITTLGTDALKEGGLVTQELILEAGGLECEEAVENIKFDGYSGPKEGQRCFETTELALDIQVYRLHANDSAGSTSTTLTDADRDNDEVLQQLRLTSLPAIGLDGLWESLIYPGNMHINLLRLAARMATIIRSHNLDENLINWNGLFLLHGPPGSGKTTLCRGLAQKLKIRLGNVYTNGRLIELHTEALFSRYFGESGKIVGEIFDKIESFADSDETLVCIIIDEVETLVAPRENSVSGDEVADAMRVTNGILTALDRLRRRPNVMVLCTSNIIDGIDSAFLDRADMVQLVPNPGPNAVYSILQSSLNELITKNIIAPTAVCETTIPRQDTTLFPPFEAMDLMAEEGSLARTLWHLSKQCLGMSGRELRRLPCKAVGLYTYSEHPTVKEVLDALQATVGKRGA